MPEYTTQKQKVESVLSETFGSPVRLGAAEPLVAAERRNLVVRWPVAEGPAGAPGSVVMKQASAGYDPEKPGAFDTWRVLNDWAGARFLSTLPEAEGCAPRFYGADRAEGIVVLQDIGSATGVDRTLTGADSRRAEETLVSLARQLGRLHAAAAPHTARYAEMRGALGPMHNGMPPFEAIRGRMTPLLEQVGVALGDPFWAEVQRVNHAVEGPGPFYTFTHGDPCPDNWLISPDGQLTLIDYEFGGLRSALVDGIYGRMTFPTCWCAGRTPEPVLRQMELAYRSELAKGCPAAEDDAAYRTAAHEACAYWAWRSVMMILPNVMAEDKQWGIATGRPRLLTRLRVFMETAAADDRFSTLLRAAEDLLQALRAAWPDTEELPVYPAFR